MLMPKIMLTNIDEEGLHGIIELIAMSQTERVQGITLKLNLVIRRRYMRDRFTLSQTEMGKKYEIPEGEKLEIPFLYPAPNGPHAYYGDIMDVHHELEAEIDRPWGIDKTSRCEVQLMNVHPRGYGMKEVDIIDVDANVSGMGSNMVVPLVRDYDHKKPSLDVIDELNKHAAYHNGLKVTDLLKPFSKSQYGEIFLEVEEGYHAPGDRVYFRIRGDLHNRLDKDMLSVELIQRECTYVGSGKQAHRRKKNHVYAQKKIPSSKLPREGYINYEDSFEIPNTHAYSWFHQPGLMHINARKHQSGLFWFIRLRVHLNSFLSWTIEEPFVVLPKAKDSEVVREWGEG